MRLISRLQLAKKLEAAKAGDFSADSFSSLSPHFS
jgi:hypothetical protein